MAAAMAMVAVGEPAPKPRAVFARPIRRIGPLIGLGCLGSLGLLVPMAALLLFEPGRAQWILSNPIVALGSSLAYLLVGIRLGFVIPSVLLTERGPLEALRHSWTLTRGEYRRLLPYFLVAGAPTLAWAVVRVLVLPETHVSRITDPVNVPATVLAMVIPLWGIYGTALTLLLWYRLRAEQEGLTFERAAQELHRPARQTLTPATANPVRSRHRRRRSLSRRSGHHD